jgi:hypothetical protein
MDTSLSYVSCDTLFMVFIIHRARFKLSGSERAGQPCPNHDARTGSTHTNKYCSMDGSPQLKFCLGVVPRTDTEVRISPTVAAATQAFRTYSRTRDFLDCDIRLRFGLFSSPKTFHDSLNF